MALRDVIIITDTDPAERNRICARKLRPRGFMLVLIGKDGGVKLRKPFPWDVRELSRQIDKMPIRQQEIRDALTGEPLPGGRHALSSPADISCGLWVIRTP